jgi:hypothetical protein
MVGIKKKKQTVSEQMQDELEPIVHQHPTEHDESDDLEMVKNIKKEHHFCVKTIKEKPIDKDA